MTRRLWLLILALLLLVAGYGYWVYRKPLPLIVPDHSQLNLQISTPPANLTWPTYGQAAVGIVGDNQVIQHGAQTPVPTASVAKVISALCVLQQKPIGAGQTGPAITLSDADVAIYNNYVAQEGSVIPVSAGEQISEYQLLEAMMLPSANNAADSLATWAFGSLPAYATYANNWLASHGLSQTHVGSDASGFSPTTTSTAYDLVKLGYLVMQQPVLAQIVGLSSAANLPLAGTIKNVNGLLGSNNVVGVKTGNTDQAGGVFLSAATKTINGHNLTLVTAIMGAPDLGQVMRDSLSLVQSAQNNFSVVAAINAGAVVGDYRLPWGGEVQAVASQSLQLPAWRGGNLSATVTLQPIKPGGGNTIVGHVAGSNSLLASQQSVSLTLGRQPSKPPLWWRLIHPSY